MQCCTLICHTYVVLYYILLFNYQAFAINGIAIKWILLYKSNHLAHDVLYMCSESDDKSGYEITGNHIINMKS